MIVLDTNVLSEPLRPHPDPHVIDWLGRCDGAAITSITAGELLVGVSRLPHGRRRATLERGVTSLLMSYAGSVLPYDLSAAEAFAKVREMRDAVGRPVTIEDAMIAGICRDRGATLATRNVKDFEGVGVELVNPWEAE